MAYRYTSACGPRCAIVDRRHHLLERRSDAVVQQHLATHRVGKLEDRNIPFSMTFCEKLANFWQIAGVLELKS